MYTIDDLNVRLLSELKDIAEGMGVKNAKKLSKQDLIYKILDQQAVAGDVAPPTPAKKTHVVTDAEPERKMRPRRRENVAPTPPPAAATPKDSDFTPDELLDSINIDFDNSMPNFDDSNETPNL